MAKPHSKKGKIQSAQPLKISPARKAITLPFPTINMVTIGGILAVIAVLLYAPSWNFDFVYDDDAVLKDNKFVRQGFDGLDEIWTTSYFKGFNENINARAYRPIPLTLFAIEKEVFGLNAKVHHSMNILLYGLTACFLFLFLSRLLYKQYFLVPLAAALFFVVHPVHVEVVANIKSRDELMAFLAFIVAGWLLLKAIDEQKNWLFGLSWVSFSVALFSKETALTTLAILPMMLWFFRDKSVKSAALLALPFAALAIFYLLIRSNIIGGINEGVQLTVLDNSLLAAKTTSERIASNILVLGVYLFKNLFPHPLLSDYSYSTIPVVGWSDYRVWLSLSAYAGLIFMAWRGIRQKWLPGYGALHFFITVSIVSSVLVLNVNAYADRFNYNPSLGVCIILAWAVGLLVKGKDNDLSVNGSLKQNWLAVSVALAIAFAGIAKTATHLPVWKNRNALFEYDMKKAPNNARTLKNHGGSLARLALEEKDAEKQKALADEAIQYLEKALAIYFRISTGHVHLGNMYGLIGNYEKAETAFKNALSIDSKSHFAATNLSNIYYRTGRHQQAIDLLETLNKKDFSQNDYYLLALAYEKTGNAGKGSQYRKLAGK